MEIINSLPKKLSILDDIENINNRLGDTDISAIGDGTVTGGLDAINAKIITPSEDRTIDLDVFDYFNNLQNHTIVTVKIATPINAGAVAHSWFTFYKSGNFGRIEQRPINSDIVYVNCCNNGNWWGWEGYARKSEVYAIKTGAITALVGGIDSTVSFVEKNGVTKRSQFLFTSVVANQTTWTNIGQIPSEFYPSRIVYVLLRDDSGNVYGGRITTDGKIGINPFQALNGVNIIGETTYF